MEIKPKHSDLGEKVSELIRNGITLTNDVMHYIDSTFLTPSAEALNRILADPSDCEAETLCELIFYPDRQMQLKLEPALTENSYDEADVESAVSYLVQQKKDIVVCFPDARGSLLLPLTDSVIRPLLARLKITQKLDPGLLTTLSRVIPDGSEILRIRVLLRNCRRQFSDSEYSFLCTCIERMYATSVFFANAFTFLLDFFEYTEPGQDIYDGLMQEKKALLKSIAQAEKNEKALEKNNVEVLMLQGVHILSIDMAQARKKIVLIDHICISIFGKTELYG